MQLKSNIIVIGLFAASLFASNIASADSTDSNSTTWDGQYLGITADLSQGAANPDVHAIVNGYFVTTDPGQVNPEASRKISATDFGGSLLWGLNRQTGNMVFGIEADLSYNSFNEQYKSANIAWLTASTTTFNVTTVVKSDWAASLRPRLGYAVEKSLIYLSAGPAIRRFKYDFTFTDTFQPQYVHLGSNKWKVGWSAGVGYEHKLQDGWNLKAEYLYSSYNGIVKARTTTVGFPNDGFNHNLEFKEHKFRLGFTKRL